MGSSKRKVTQEEKDANTRAAELDTRQKEQSAKIDDQENVRRKRLMNAARGTHPFRGTQATRSGARGVTPGAAASGAGASDYVVDVGQGGFKEGGGVSVFEQY